MSWEELVDSVAKEKAEAVMRSIKLMNAILTGSEYSIEKIEVKDWSGTETLYRLRGKTVKDSTTTQCSLTINETDVKTFLKHSTDQKARARFMAYVLGKAE